MNDTGFQTFAATPGYPYTLPMNGALSIGSSGSFPTNSWAEAAVVDKNNIFVNAWPWQWSTSYADDWDRSFLLGYAGRLGYASSNDQLTPGTVTTTHNGNITVIDVQSPQIKVYAESRPLQTVALTRLDDFGCTFSAGTSFTAFANRGSPFAVFAYVNKQAIIDFTVGYNILSVEKLPSISNFIYRIRTDSYRTSQGIFDMLEVPHSATIIRTVDAAFYNEYNRIPGQAVTVQLSGISAQPTITATIPSLAMTVEWVVGNVPTFTGNAQSVTGDKVHIPAGSNRSGYLIVITLTNDDVYTILLDTGNPTDGFPNSLLFLTSAIKQNYSFLIVSDFELNLNAGSSTLSSAAGSTGMVRIAEYNSFTLSNYSKVLISASIGGFTANGGYTVDMNYMGDGNYLMYYPSAVATTGLESTTLFKLSPSYENVQLYMISGSLTVLNTVTTIPPLISEPYGDALSVALKTYIPIDAAKVLADNSPVFAVGDVYNSSIAFFGVCRLLVHMQKTGVINQYKVQADKVAAQFRLWMSNMNSAVSVVGCPSYVNEAFFLQYEEAWGGIIVPADYYNITGICSAYSSYFNSYYTDHHFQYGYLLYTACCLHALGYEDIFVIYNKQLTSIVRDIVNPTTNNFAWQTRHKDWYSGSSWATGITSAVLIQQESSGEAVNGYYACYIASKILGLTDEANVSAACLGTEMLSSRKYYMAPTVGDLSKAAAVGILLSTGRQVNLNFPVNPNTYNGRAMGVYGIECLPFSDIWTEHIRPENINLMFSNSIEPSYRLTPELIATMCDAGTYVPVLASNEEDTSQNFNPVTDGNFWGLIALKMACRGTASMNSTQIDNCFISAVNKEKLSPTFLLRQFDTYTDTYYWIGKTGHANTFGVNVIVTPQSSIAAVPGPIAIPSCKEMIERSDYRDQCLVKVPLIFASSTIVDEGTQVGMTYYQIIDKHCYLCPFTVYKSKGCRTDGKGCSGTGTCVGKVQVTSLETNLNPNLVIRVPSGLPANATIKQKAGAFGLSSEELLSYAILRLGLSYLMFGSFDLKYLRQSYVNEFFRRLTGSSFCAFSEFFLVRDYGMYFLM